MFQCPKCKLQTTKIHGMKIHLGRDHKITGERQLEIISSLKPLLSGVRGPNDKPAATTQANAAPQNEKTELHVFMGMGGEAPIGWMCPVCKTVYSPFVKTCEKHRQDASHPIMPDTAR